jgi:hypothetical protein
MPKPKKTLYYKNVPFKPTLRKYKAIQIAGKWKIFNTITRKARKNIQFDTQKDAVMALKDLKKMMNDLSYTPEELELAKQQGRVAYEKQMRKRMSLKKKPKPKSKLPPVPKFNEKKEKYKKRLKRSRGSSTKNPIFIY